MENLVSLAVNEGLHEAVDTLGPSLAVVEKPRLDPGAETPSPNVELDASEGLLDYSLLESMEGKKSPVFETEESRDVACGAWVPRFSASLESSSGRVRRIQLLSG